MGEQNDKPIVEHQHKHIVNGEIKINGFVHPLSLQHKDEKTKMIHDITIKIDTGRMGGLNYGQTK